MKIRTKMWLMGGKIIGSIVRLAGAGGGTTFPGKVVRSLHPRFVPEVLSGLELGCVLVTGTNGKTTTAALVADILKTANIPLVHNRTGANLMSGIASALIKQSLVDLEKYTKLGLFEVDEAVLPEAIDETDPRIVLINNLFRDQLDRYGELDTLAGKMKASVEKLSPESTLILNADDPLVSSIGAHLKCKVIYFGINTDAYSLKGIEHAADSKHCSLCGTRLEYGYHIFGHLGNYRCPKCGAERPDPDVFAESVRLKGFDGSNCSIRTPAGNMELWIPLPGLYNVYNVLGAIAVSLTLGIEPEAIADSIEQFKAAFGRVEKIQIDGRKLVMILAKNPAGFNEVIRALSNIEGGLNIIFALNDNIADGRDVSWIWDVDFENLKGKISRVICSGIRAWDMALRIKYADTEAPFLWIEPHVGRAMERLIESVEKDGTVYVVPTYTAMLDARRILSKKGYVSPYWEE